MRRPLFIVLVIMIGLGGLAAWEFPNYLKKPSLRAFPFVEKGCRIELFSDGARVRETAVFIQAKGMEVLLDVFGNDGRSLTGGDFGSLRWTQDGTALVATELEGGKIETDRALWVFDTVKMAPVEAWAREITIGDRGGLGNRVFSWFDLGREGSYVFSWEAKRRREDLRRRIEVVENETSEDS